MWWMLLLAAQQPADPDATVARMAALYDELCLKAFPDDKVVDTLMAAKGAKPMTPDEVRVTFRDDPGRGWLLDDGDRKIQIMLELPPYHACSVRGTLSHDIGDLSTYRTLADAYETSRPGFAAIKAMDRDMGDIHVHGAGEQRILPDKGGEGLLVIDQHVIDPERRAKGETGVDLRFVHQLVSRS